MPLTNKGKKIMRAMKSQYGSEEGKKVFYASKNKGTIKGVEDETQMNWQDRIYESLVESKSLTSLERAERRIKGASKTHRGLAKAAIKGSPVVAKTKAEKFAKKVRIPKRLQPEAGTHRLAAVIAKTSKKKKS